MISQLTGTIAFSGDKFVVLSVGGVGYHIKTTLDTERRAIETAGDIIFYTHLAVREDALDLYGFLSRAELSFFQMLISVSGIGPKTALGILNSAPIESLASAIGMGDSASLSKISGIGAKNAQKIILELKEKVGVYSGKEMVGNYDAILALQSLGYSAKEARDAIQNIEKGTSEKDIIRKALRIMSNNHK